jgi:hypothetical protein
MPRAYGRNGYRFSPTQFTLADFSARTSLQVGPDEYSTVEEIDVEKGSAVVVGQGTSSNPLQAEGSIRGDIQDDGNADINGRYRMVVLNEQNNIKMDGIVAEGTIDEIEATRANSLDGDITPYTGMEIYEPDKLGLQLKTGSGTAVYSPSNSSLTVDGYRGEKLR